MNGHFEVAESNYPIGVLASAGDYRVFDMRSLNPLHPSPISRDLAYKAAAKANEGIREKTLPAVADSEEVAVYVQEFIAESEGV